MEEMNDDLKRSPFKVPDNYFETFDAKVMGRLYQKNTRMHISGIVKRWSIAASVFIVAAVSVFFYSTRKIEKFDLAEVQVSEMELASFCSNAEISVDELADLVSTRFIDSIYHAEIVLDGNNVGRIESEMSVDIDEEYSPLDDEETEI